MLKTYAATVKNGRLKIAGGEPLPDGNACVTVEVRADGTPTADGPAAVEEDLPQLRSPRLVSSEDAGFFRMTVRRTDPADAGGPAAPNKPGKR